MLSYAVLIDVPRTRVREIEQAVSRHHLEAGLGGVGGPLFPRESDPLTWPLQAFLDIIMI